MKSTETRAALIAQAAAIINAEFSRLHLDPLNSEQVDALGDESQAFEMLDDFEARLGVGRDVCATVAIMLGEYRKAQGAQ